MEALPFIISHAIAWDLSMATIDQLKVVVTSDGKPRLEEFAAELSGLVLFPSDASRIDLEAAAGAVDSGGIVITAEGRAGGGPFSVALDTSGGKGLRADFSVLGIAAFVTSVAGVSADSLGRERGLDGLKLFLGQHRYSS